MTPTYVPPEAVEAAHSAIDAKDWGECGTGCSGCGAHRGFNVGVDAAALLIAAQALRDAADAYASGRLTGAFLSRDDYARAWLRARAARIEKEARDDA